MNKPILIFCLFFLVLSSDANAMTCPLVLKKIAGWVIGLHSPEEKLNHERLIALVKENYRTELFPGEAWLGGSRDAEIEAVVKAAEELHAAQKVFAKRNGDTGGKTQHRGGLGGWISEVEILDVPPELQHDWLAEPAGTKLVGISNFTTGMGNKKLPFPLRFLKYWYGSPDIPQVAPDVLGWAGKYWKPGSAVVNDTVNGTNSHSAFAETPPRFGNFVSVQAANLLTILPKGLWWALNNPGGVARLVDSTLLRARKSALAQVYGTGHATAFGDTAARFTVELAPDSPIAKENRGFSAWIKGIGKGLWDGKHLSNDLLAYSQQGDVELIVYAQLLPDGISEKERTRLIESGLAKWETPKIPVAKVRMLKNGLTPQSTALANKLAFNTGNTFGESYPIGMFGRFREALYKVSQLGRIGPEEQVLANFVNGHAFPQELAGVEELYNQLVPTEAEIAAAKSYKPHTETKYFRGHLRDSMYDDYFNERGGWVNSGKTVLLKDPSRETSSHIQSILKQLLSLEAELKANAQLATPGRQANRHYAESFIPRDIATLRQVLKDRGVTEEAFDTTEYFRSDISDLRYGPYFGSTVVPPAKYDTVVLRSNMKDATDHEIQMALKEVRSLYAEFLASDIFKLHSYRYERNQGATNIPKDIASLRAELRRRGLVEESFTPKYERNLPSQGN